MGSFVVKGLEVPRGQDFIIFIIIITEETVINLRGEKNTGGVRGWREMN